MGNVTSTNEMLIRKPAADVFQAFVEPRILESFWLKKSSGALGNGAVVAWDFMVEGAHETVAVNAFSPHELIGFTWSSGVQVRIGFEERPGDITKVAITATGFTGDDLLEQVANTTEGFAIVLCDLKSLMETGQSGNMVRDKTILISERKNR